MQQLSKIQAILYPLYRGIFITIGFIILSPISIKYGFPPQTGMMLAILFIAMPLLLWHLRMAGKTERKNKVTELNGFTNRLPAGKLILYSVLMVVLAFVIWG